MNNKNDFKFATINCWTDGSGFEFDGEPVNLIGPTNATERFFSLTGRMAKNSRVGYQLWSNWVDKFQIDNRFLLLSDENAEAILYPNVDDPWMFTEYIFKGVGKEYDPNDKTMKEISCLIIEPPLYDENTLMLINPDRIIPKNMSKKQLDEFNEFDIKNECANYNRERISDGNKIYVKSCRTIDENGWGSGYPVNDPGVKLYKVSVNVESVKWGEHGNIPPHTLNMCSPSSWLDTKTKKTIQPVTIAKVGYPVYANTNGTFYHAKNNFDYIIPTEWTDEEEHISENPNLTKFYYAIPTEDDTSKGTMQSKGRAAISVETNASKNEMTLKYIMQSQNGDLIYDGMCEFFSAKGGCAYCTLANENDLNSTNELRLNKELCLKGNVNCPKYIKKSPTAISTYETVARTKDQYYSATYGMYGSEDEKYASNFMDSYNAMGAIGGGIGTFLGMGMLNRLTTYYQPGLRDYTEKNVYFETSFKIIDTPVEDFEITSPSVAKGNENGKGVRVVRGSGNQNIDNIIPWKGGDSYAIGDADQVNFARLTQSVMPCYNPSYCNEICGMAMQSGYEPGVRAGGESEKDGESEYVNYCKYYKNKNKGVECPFDNIPKTAYEFQEAQIIGCEKLEQIIKRWIGNYDSEIETNNIVFEENTMFVIKEEESIEKDYVESENPDEASEELSIEHPIRYVLYGKNDESSNIGGLCCNQTNEVKVFVPLKDENNDYVYDENGNYKVEEKEITAYKICKFTLTSINPSNAQIDDIFFWWKPLDNNGNTIYKNSKEVIWFCKYDKKIVRSTHFTHYVDNWNKFIGGSHPYYKDYSKRGGEYIQEKTEMSLEERDDGMGDIGGDPEYSGIEEPKSKRGYWIDEDGEWILDEVSLGESLVFDDDGNELPKITHKEEFTNKMGVTKTETFSFTKKEKEVFDKRNERENPNGVSLSFKKSNTIINSDGTRKSPQTTNCSININDTAELIRALRFSPPMRTDEDGNETPMPPSVSDVTALPAERWGAYCKHCDYYLNEKYGISHNNETVGLICPWCGTELTLKPIKKLHKQKSIGQVDYWGLPGTVIDSKSYFWKSPTLINNAMLDQIKFKALKNASNANADSELTQGHTFDYKGYYKPIPSLEEEQQMPENERKNIWNRVKDKDREDISMYNDLINAKRIPSTGLDVSETEDRLIVPYSDTDGLRFFTLEHLKKLRKAVEPAMGYLIGKFPSNPDYERMRPTYENRTEATATRYWVKGRCGVEPEILAGNTAGRECFIQFWSGSPETGAVRMYFPPGLTWWFNNKLIGLRHSDNKGSGVHLDDGTYGDQTRSMMCCFLHGFLPLNKKILAAYAIITPGQYPSRAPLGLDWSGRTHYQHYHAFTRPTSEVNIAGTPHEQLGQHLHKEAGNKNWVYDDVGDMIPWSAVGQPNRELYKKIWEKPGWWNETGDVEPNKNCYWVKGDFQSSDESKYNRMFFDEDGVPHYVKKRPQNNLGIKLIKEGQIGEFKDDGRLPEWVEITSGIRTIITKNAYQSYYDFDESTMTEMTSDLSHFFDDGWWGKLEYGKPVWDYIKLEGQYEEEEGFESNWTKWGKDIIQLKTSNEIWKQLTSEEFDEIVELGTGSFNFCCSNGEVENSRDFVSTNVALIKDFFPEQMQEIPGYFNYKGMNSALTHNANTHSKKPEVDEKWSNEQILYQVEGDEKNTTVSNEYLEGGSVPIVLNITDTVKKAYEKRIDREFVCKAGKTLAETVESYHNKPASEWRGDGAEKDYSKKERELWNKRPVYKEDNSLLLSNDFHYPKLNSNKEIIKSTNGEKLERETICQTKVFQAKDEFPIEISKYEDENNIIKLKMFFNDKDEKTITKYLFSAEEIENMKIYKDDELAGYKGITFKEYCAKVQSRLNEGGADCIIYTFKDRRWYMEIKNCESFILLEGGATDVLFYDINETTNSIANRIVSFTSSLPGYSPLNLIKCDRTSMHPSKNDGWKTDVFTNENQSFIIDLCQTPYEEFRRDWRYRQGTSNCTNCICPNESCSTRHYTKKVGTETKQITVGEWAGMKNIQMGNGQTSCPSCGTDLSNADGKVAIDSDNIKSYYYEEVFDYNPFIQEIRILTSDDDIFKCGFNVYCQNPDTGVWICLLSARYDKTNNKFSETHISQVEVKEVNNGFYITLKLNESNNFRTRYLKIETFNNEFRESYSIDYLEKGREGDNIFYENIISTPLHTEIETDVLIGQVIRFSSNEIPDWEKENENENDFKIISNYIQDNRLIIKVDGFIPQDIEFCKFYAKKYRSGIDVLEVYGLPFKNSDISILPPADFELGDSLNGEMKLSQQPIQIINVYAGSTNGGMIQLDPADSSNENLYFETEKRTIKNPNKENEEISYYEIVGGNWYYNPKKNTIHIPKMAKKDEELVFVENLNRNLFENGIFLKINDVSQVMVEYWNASHRGLTLEAEAAGTGPSYQLETESICVIRDKDKLPDCGESVELFTDPKNPNSTKKQKIEWFCYNHIPSTLKENVQTNTGGYFRKPTFYGTELGKISGTGNNSKKFIDLFGENCENIGPSCFTEVTFYGKPNTILTGNIVAIAPKEHKFTYNFGEKVTATEKTGGLADGCFVLEIRPSEKAKGRKTMSWNDPLIVVYAEDEDPFK